MAEIVLLIFKEFCPHVVILADIFFIGAGLPLFMILKFDITGNPVLLQIQEILLAAVSAVCRHFLQLVTKDLLMLFQHWDQGIVIRTVITYVSMDNKIVLHCDLDVVDWF